MDVVEVGAELLRPGLVDLAGVDLDPKLVPLAGVASVDDALDNEAFGRNPVRLELPSGLLLELRKAGRERSGIQRRQALIRRRHVLVDHVRGQEAHGRRDARERWDDDVRRPHLDRDLRREERAGASLGDQREVARVESLADGVLFDGLDHGVREDLHRSHRRFLDGHPESLRRAVLECPPGQVGLKLHAPAEERLGTEPAENDHGVGRGRLGAAASVRRRARVGARRARPDAEDAALVDVGDRAAAGADRVDVDHRDHRLVGTDLRVQQVLHAELAALRKPDVGRGPADVERDHVLVARLPSRPDAADDTGDGPGHEEVHRARGCRLRRRHAAGRGHEMDVRPYVQRP